MKNYLALTILSLILIGVSSCKTKSLIGVSSCKTKSLPIQGTWLLVLENGKPVTSKIHIKNYTDTHFSWEIADLEKNILLAGSGPYEINKNVVIETIEYTAEGYPYHGTKSTLEMELRNDTLFTKGKMNLDGLTWTEAHVRLK